MNLQRPLAGKTILVTRSAGQSSQFGDRLQEAGAQVVEMPALVIGPPSTWGPLDRAIAQLSTYNWLILTSTNAVDYFFHRLETTHPDSQTLKHLKIAVVGKKTAESLQSRGFVPNFIPPNFVADSLVTHFPDPLGGCKILFPRVETGGRDVLVKEFSQQGAEVTEVPAYESGCPDRIPPEALKFLQNRAIHAMTFASSKTVQNFYHLTTQEPSLPDNWLEGVFIASIGPETSKACKTWLGRLDAEAKEYTLDGLTATLLAWAKSQL